MTFSHAVSTNNYGPAKFIVDASAANGTHTTIAAALTSATSGDTIFIRPGTYTENLTLKAGVDLVTFIGDADTPNVTIIGTCTMTVAGTCSISGIRLQTNSAALLAVTGTLASIVNLRECYLNCSNNTGITFSSSSGSAAISLYSCTANLGTTGIAIFSHSSSGTLLIEECDLLNSGGSTTANTLSAGTFNCGYTNIRNPITITGTGIYNVGYTNHSTSLQNVTCLTAGGTSSQANFCSFSSGSASAVSIGTAFGLYRCIVDSTNTNAVTGAGTLTYSDISFPNTSYKINTTTQTKRNVDIGGISFDGGTNLIANGTNNIVIASNASGVLANRSYSTVIQTFTTSGTYTPTTGMLYCVVEMVGGGGGSGGAQTAPAGQYSGGGAGGGAEYARGVFSAATIGASQTATVGTGGIAGTAGANLGGTGVTTSLGALLTAIGGTGGPGGLASATTQVTLGGIGGTGGTGGSFHQQGQPGGIGITVFPTQSVTGAGGISFFGGGAFPQNGQGTGNPGQLYGSGASGAICYNEAGKAGQAGAAGLIVVTEYVIN